MTRAEKIERIGFLLGELSASLQSESWERMLEAAESLNQLGAPESRAGSAYPASSEELDCRGKIILAWQRATECGRVAQMQGEFARLVLSEGTIKGETLSAIEEAQACLSRIQ